MTARIEVVDTTEVSRSGADAPHPHRWYILGVLGLAQLMIVLDTTIVNIALPVAQLDLGFSNDNRQWVITAYSLAFGSLLLLGGRLGDMFGRKRMFLIGLVGFAAMSAVGGAATGFGVLVVARAGQGAFGAVLAPAALSLLSTTFTLPTERNKAFGIYSAIAGGGGALGLLLGGFLTDEVSWRWCLYVNVFFAVVSLLAGLKFLLKPEAGHRPKIDLLGTVTATAGLFGLVYGVAHAETTNWSNATTIEWLVAGVTLLVAFVFIELSTSHPLLPMRIVLDRDRGGAYLGLFVSGVGIFALFLFMTYYLQGSLGYSPIRTGLAFTPVLIGIVLASTVILPRVLPRTGPRPITPVGMLLTSGGLLLLTQVTLDSHYWVNVGPAMSITGLGLGLVMGSSIQTATAGVVLEDAGIASAMVNTSQQVGGSIGTALLSTIAATAAGDYVLSHGHGHAAHAQAAVESYTAAFGWAAGIFAAGAIATALLLRTGPLPSNDVALP
jgi:EmrB/QacA subfamily drug resistance transporter